MELYHIVNFVKSSYQLFELKIKYDINYIRHEPNHSFRKLIPSG
ncbi:MAG: hypothetical protein QG614_352 [Patescibacteria group bacterium]|nr:hypothetical protein [Patescibacteria group bacterium]